MIQNLPWIRSLVALGLSVLLLTGCFTTTPVISPFSTPLPGDYKLAQKEKALQDAALEMGWSMRKEGGHYIGRLVVRTHMIKVRFVFKDDELQAHYVDSGDMNYDGRVIHKKYHMWIDRLFVTTKKELRSQS